MFLDYLYVDNSAGHKLAEIHFSNRIAYIVGGSPSETTSILDAIALNYSHLLRRIGITASNLCTEVFVRPESPPDINSFNITTSGYGFDESAYSTNHSPVVLYYSVDPNIYCKCGALDIPERYYREWINPLQTGSSWRMACSDESIDTECYQKICLQRALDLLYPDKKVEVFNINHKNFGYSIDSSGSISPELNQFLTYVIDLAFRVSLDDYGKPLEEAKLRHCLVLIDDIDAFIAPDLQPQLLPVLREVFPTIQFIVTTNFLSTMDSLSDIQKINYRIRGTKMKEFNFTHGLTHTGKFHADDVFATALCKLLNPEFTYTRVPKISEDTVIEEGTLIYDIGNGIYDHHNKETLQYRPNGIPYAAFGLLWKDFGYLLCEGIESVQEQVDQYLVSVIDGTDNGMEMNMLTRAINYLFPANDTSHAAIAVAFDKAVTFAKEILSGAIAKSLKAYFDNQMIQKTISVAQSRNSKVLIFDKYVGMCEEIVKSDALFTLIPALKGGYNLTCIPKSMETFGDKIKFPEAWAGKESTEAEIATGVPGTIFVHANRFLAVAETIEAALELAELAIEQASGATSFFS